MTKDDLTYYRKRAELELEKAQRARSSEAVAAHFQLAEAYLERIAAVEEGTRSSGDTGPRQD